MGLEALSFGLRLTRLAEADGAAPALTFVAADGRERVVTRRELDRESNRVARLLCEHGVDERSTVVVGLPNSPQHFFATFGAWKLGALVLPLSARLPAAERDAVLAVAGADAVVADWPDMPEAVGAQLLLDEAARWADGPLPDRTPRPGKAVASGGSTGRPKVIVDPSPLALEPGAFTRRFGEFLGVPYAVRQLVTGPLYHNLPFTWAYFGLFDEHELVVMERFDAATAVELVQRHHIELLPLVPTTMRRIVELPRIRARDLSSLRSVYHTAAVCPPWVKRAWIELVGPTRVFEAFGATEGVGATVIRGDEWLERPGSVGRPLRCDVRIADEAGAPLPAGAVGEIWMRPHAAGPTYEYRGAPPAKTDGEGFVSLGDLGWLDEAGWLFVADRRVDLIITGGANVYPAEVEGALVAHPAVDDAVVIGLPDEAWGRRVHAIVQPAEAAAPPTPAALAAHCRERLAGWKVPKTWELVERLPRDEAGKVRRGALVREREAEKDAEEEVERTGGPRKRGATGTGGRADAGEGPPLREATP